MVAQEHHGFLAALMGLLGKPGHFSSLEILEITELFGRDPVGIIHIALVDDIFRAELIARFLLELLQDIGADRCGISIPVHIFLSGKLIEDQGELMEEGGVTDHVHMRIVRDEFPQAPHGILMGLGLAHIKGDLLLKIGPAVGHRIVHMHRVPHDVGQEADRIVVERFCPVDSHISGLSVVSPLGCRDNLSCGAVDHFPPSCDVIPVIYL